MIKSYPILLMIVFLYGNTVGQVKTRNTSEKSNTSNAAKKSFLTYTVSISESDKRCQVLINDVPLMYYEGEGPRSFYANGAILESGIQDIKIISEGKAPVVTINETLNVPGTYKETQIWKNEGLLQGKFTAAVLYDIVGWKQSKVLSNEKTAQEQALKWFTKMGILLRDGKGSKFMEKLLPAEKTAATLYDLKEEETRKFHTNWINYISRKEYNMVPVSKCKVEIVGYGKLIHLVNELNEGGFALKANNGQLLLLDIYLHLPDGKTEMEPVLANFKQITSNYKKLLEGEQK